MPSSSPPTAALPEAFEQMVLAHIVTLRAQLERGERIEPMAILDAPGSDHPVPVPMSTESEEAKQASAELIRTAVQALGSRWVLTRMEAWSVSTTPGGPTHSELIARYGSLSRVPGAQDILFVQFETAERTWVARLPIRARGASKRRRTVGAPVFQCIEMAGTFSGWLARSAPPEATLH